MQSRWSDERPPPQHTALLVTRSRTFTNAMTQMMFVSGETADVAPETTSMIEGIVQQQVMEMVGATRYSRHAAK